MSESAKTLIKYFCDRFLDIDYYPTNLKSVLDLDINKLKNINDDDSHKFKRIEIETLRDLSMVDVGNYERLSKKALIDNSTFKRFPVLNMSAEVSKYKPPGLTLIV